MRLPSRRISDATIPARSQERHRIEERFGSCQRDDQVMFGGETRHDRGDGGPPGAIGNGRFAELFGDPVAISALR